MKLQSLALLSLASVALAAPSWWEQWTLDKHQPELDAVLQDQEFRLVQTAHDQEPFWASPKERLAMFRNKVNYMDITDNQDLDSYRASSLGKKSLPKEAVHQKRVARYAGKLSAANMEIALTEFTKFPNRYYNNDNGHRSAQWLFKQIGDLIEQSEAENDVSVRKFDHDWKQFSIIARFEGRDESLWNEPVIVGAHQDSLNMWLPFLSAPGADDDGSGTTTILEVFRALVSTGFRPLRPVEFHWYSGEEVGLLGSQDIAQKYAKRGVKVIAMIQNDMTGYVASKESEAYGIVVDHVDPALTNLLRNYAQTYGDLRTVDTKCGYACSDHASWGKAGYRSAFAIEGEFKDNNPYIHTANDVISHIDFNHMLQFAKLSLGFAVELGFYQGDEEDRLC
ncbi:leucine aminopeptidase 1 [Mortierella sp. GBAus27b]|nr:leucine aminopeptidase 1 [Mortierella sp. GBAus27b]